MMALKMIRQHKCPINYSLGNEIGHGGADGEVYEIKNDSSKVVKFSVIYEWDIDQLPAPIGFPADIKLRYQNISKVLDHLISNPEPAYVRVYAREYLGEYTRPVVFNNEMRDQKMILHYYVMEKLNKLSDDEFKVFHSILSHEDRNINKNFTIKKIKEMLAGMSVGLDFDTDKVIFFIENFKTAPIIYNDLHPRNIVKNSVGDFLLIDLDRSKLTIGE